MSGSSVGVCAALQPGAFNLILGLVLTVENFALPLLKSCFDQLRESVKLSIGHAYHQPNAALHYHI